MEPITTRLGSVTWPRSSGASRCGYLANEKREFPDPSRLRGARRNQWLVLRGGIALERALIDWYDDVLATLDKKAGK